MAPAKSAVGEPAPATRFGMTATKKFGKSVQRNRAKRLIREAIRTLESQIVSGYDIVIVVRSGALGLAAPEACRLLRDLLLRSKLIDSSQHRSGVPRYPRRPDSDRGSQGSSGHDPATRSALASRSPDPHRTEDESWR